MSRPDVGPVTDRLYDRLPELYREADAEQLEPDYPLLRFLSLLLDQLTAVETLGDRLTYVARDELAGRWQRFGDGTFGDGTFGDRDTADLVDARMADAGWLPWLGQLLGVPVAGLTVTEQRVALENPSRAWAHGTPTAIAELARRELTGGKYADTVPNFRDNPYTIALVTKREETAGSTTWGELKAIAPTWGDLERLGDWGNAEAAVVVQAVAAEQPAGYKLTHVYLEDLYA